MKISIPVLAILLLFPFTSLADPSPGIKWLQNEPLTLFDFGMHKANNDFEEMLKKGNWKVLASLLRDKHKEDGDQSSDLVEILKHDFSSVRYDFEKNHILFETLILIERLTFKDSFKKTKEINKHRKSLVDSEMCKSVTVSIAQALFVFKKVTDENAQERWFRERFSHSGFQNIGRPKSLEKELGRISEIKVHLGFGDIFNLKGHYPISCSMPFAGGRPVSVTKNTKF